MTSEPDLPVHAGDVIAGKYRVERVLGVGGMGFVVAATHLQLDQPVALKFVQPSIAAGAQAIERFLREARAAARLRSEHVARVIDVGTAESGAPFIVMELLDGADLAHVVERSGALPIATAVDYVLQACEAVAEAHAAGIVHRDIKPQNLFLTRRVDGSPLVKVLDFGISKMLSKMDMPSTSQRASITRTASVMGSPLYMAPEQMRSARHVDPRADVWALGVVLYELLTGHVPFDADTMPELCLKVVHDPPRPIEDARSDVPEALKGVLARCLEKDPAKRFADASGLGAALEPFAPPIVRRSVERTLAATPGTSGFGATELAGPRATRDPREGRGSWPVIPVRTPAAWGEPSLARPPRRTRMVVASVGGIALVAAVVVAFGRRAGPVPAAVAGSASVTSVAAPVAPSMKLAAPAEPAASAPQLPPIAPAVPSPVASGPAALDASAAPPLSPLHAAPAPRPAVTAASAPPPRTTPEPKPSAAPDDDIPSLR